MPSTGSPVTMPSLTPRKGRRGMSESSSLGEAIKKRADEGATPSQLTKEFPITIERARQVVQQRRRARRRPTPTQANQEG